MSEVLIPGALGRLPAYGSNAPTTARIPMYYPTTGKASYVTPDQIASGASAVDGPASATDNAIARFDGITGKIIQDSAVTVADTTGAISIVGTTNQFVLGTTNTTTVNAAAPAASITTNLPIVSGSIASTTGSNLFYVDVKRSTAQKDSITTALADVTGLTGQTLVAGATYRFRCILPGTADGTSGIKYAFKYTTATLTSIEATGLGFTASAVAVQHTTTTTDATLLFDQAAVVILVELVGTMVVNAGGTVALQIGTHTGTTTCSCYVGASMEFVRIA